MEQHIKLMKETVIAEEDQIVTLLGSLPDSYSTLVTALETRMGDLTLTYVQQALVNEDQRRSLQSNMVPYTASDFRPDAANVVGQGRNFNRSKVRLCNECNSPNHLKRDCPNLKNTQQKSSEQYQHKANQVNEAEDSDSAFVVQNPENTSDVNRWLIDSGATSHMTHDRSLFKKYTRLDTPQKVSLGDGHALEVVGVGEVEVYTKVNRNTSKPNTMYDVLHVSAMKVNLFSVRSAAMKNVISQFGHTRCWLKNKRGKVRATGTMIDKLYYLDTVNNVHHASIACDLWHQRLGHASADAIKSANSLVVGADLSKVSVDVCEPCIKGKMSKKPFSKHADIKSCRPLELVHTDVCGPMKTKSIGGSVYFVSFIDDYTRYAFLYFIREKSQVFEKFKAFEALATNQVGLAIGTLRSDNGGEYISNEFESYLCSKGIHH